MSETDQMLEIQRMADSLREGYLSLQQVVIRTLEIFPDEERMLLIIDQFEELYTLCPEPEVRQRFLDEILEIAQEGLWQSAGAEQPLCVIVLAFGGQMTGIVVDRIAGREGVLTRPLDRHLAGIREFSGAALLGDGRIALMLDPMGLF